jgi:transcriptional antiterminator NusG
MSEEKTDAFAAALAAATVESVAAPVDVEVEAAESKEAAETESEAIDAEVSEGGPVVEPADVDAAEEDASNEIEATEGEDDENDPNAEFRRALRTAAGDWYVVHSYAGYEKKVKANLFSLNMEDYI